MESQHVGIRKKILKIRLNKRTLAQLSDSADFINNHNKNGSLNGKQNTREFRRENLIILLIHIVLNTVNHKVMVTVELAQVVA